MSRLRRLVACCLVLVPAAGSVAVLAASATITWPSASFGGGNWLSDAALAGGPAAPGWYAIAVPASGDHDIETILRWDNPDASSGGCLVMTPGYALASATPETHCWGSASSAGATWNQAIAQDFGPYDSSGTDTATGPFAAASFGSLAISAGTGAAGTFAAFAGADSIAAAFADGQTSLLGYVTAGIGLIAALLLAGIGVKVLVRYLRRAGAAA